MLSPLDSGRPDISFPFLIKTVADPAMNTAIASSMPYGSICPESPDSFTSEKQSSRSRSQSFTSVLLAKLAFCPLKHPLCLPGLAAPSPLRNPQGSCPFQFIDGVPVRCVHRRMLSFRSADEAHFLPRYEWLRGAWARHAELDRLRRLTIRHSCGWREGVITTPACAAENCDSGLDKGRRISTNISVKISFNLYPFLTERASLPFK
jgi:hypothetical protein